VDAEDHQRVCGDDVNRGAWQNDGVAYANKITLQRADQYAQGADEPCWTVMTPRVLFGDGDILNAELATLLLFTFLHLILL